MFSSLEEFQVILNLTHARSAAKCLLYYNRPSILQGIWWTVFLEKVYGRPNTWPDSVALLKLLFYNIFPLLCNNFAENHEVLVLFNMWILLMLQMLNTIWMAVFFLVGSWLWYLLRKTGRNHLIWGQEREEGMKLPCIIYEILYRHECL